MKFLAKTFTKSNNVFGMAILSTNLKASNFYWTERLLSICSILPTLLHFLNPESYFHFLSVLEYFSFVILWSCGVWFFKFLPKLIFLYNFGHQKISLSASFHARPRSQKCNEVRSFGWRPTAILILSPQLIIFPLLVPTRSCTRSAFFLSLLSRFFFWYLSPSRIDWGLGSKLLHLSRSWTQLAWFYFDLAVPITSVRLFGSLEYSELFFCWKTVLLRV